MLLAGGQGSRLQVLTSETAKPAVPFGGKYRIIDFTLSNCVNSGIDTVGVLTQYRPLELNRYIGNGAPWDLNRNHGGVFVLPPYATGETGEWYLGTANAISQNISFIDQYNPDYVLVLSGDHIYKMDYSKMLDAHEKNNADTTIAVIPVPIEEASRYGIMNADEENRISSFEEKPKKPKSNKASMGVYIFTWKVLREYLIADDKKPTTNHDFGKDIIPAMLEDNLRMFCYPFTGYWKDVGTIESLWSSNMDLLNDPPTFNLYDSSWRIYSRNAIMPAHHIGMRATVSRSIVSEGAEIYGNVTNSIIFSGVVVEEDAVIVDSIIMPNVLVKEHAQVFKTIIGERATIGAYAKIGEIVSDMASLPNDGITVLGECCMVPENMQIDGGSVVDCHQLEKEEAAKEKAAKKAAKVNVEADKVPAESNQ